jgi:Helix-turn-helix of insertion element transposase
MRSTIIFQKGEFTMATRKELEAKLTLPQRKAALMLVENELETEEKKSQDEIAAECGVTRMGLYKWRTQNKAFIEYRNMLADDFFSSMRPMVYRQIIKAISGPQPSIKAIDIFMKRFALLSEKTIVEDHTGGNEGRTDDALKRELDELDELLKD